MKTITYSNNSKISVVGWMLFIALVLCTATSTIYAIQVSSRNAKLEENLRMELLRNERLLSEKLALEKEFEFVRHASISLENKVEELEKALQTVNKKLDLIKYERSGKR